MKRRTTITLVVVVTVIGCVIFWPHYWPPIRTPVSSFSIDSINNDPPSFAQQQIPISETLYKFEDQRVILMVSKAAAFQEKLAEVSSQLKLKWVGERGFTPSSGTLSRSGASLQSSGAQFKFWLPFYQLTSWNNDQLELAQIKESHDSANDSPPKPLWQKDQASQIGLTFIKTLLDGREVKMTPAEATFISHPTRDSSGEWLITWNRAENHGYPFQSAQFKVKIPEGYCPIEVQIPEITPYEEKTSMPISLEQASAIAHRNAPDSATTWSMPSSPEVVRGHLLWMFYYNDPKNFRGGSVVYLDAYTGELVPVFEP